jgi:hypothetical protein
MTRTWVEAKAGEAAMKETAGAATFMASAFLKATTDRGLRATTACPKTEKKSQKSIKYESMRVTSQGKILLDFLITLRDFLLTLRG